MVAQGRLMLGQILTERQPFWTRIDSEMLPNPTTSEQKTQQHNNANRSFAMTKHDSTLMLIDFEWNATWTQQCSTLLNQTARLYHDVNRIWMQAHDSTTMFIDSESEKQKHNFEWAWHLQKRHFTRWYHHEVRKPCLGALNRNYDKYQVRKSMQLLVKHSK